MSEKKTHYKSFPKALNVSITSYFVDVIDLLIATETGNLREMWSSSFANIVRVRDNDSSTVSQFNNIRDSLKYS